jgi:hypothetical protein
LHEVIYQTPAGNAAGAIARYAAIFAHYSGSRSFNEIFDNGFGQAHRRADMERYALWSYAMDITTVGTVAFHPIKWGPPKSAELGADSHPYGA